MKDREGQGQIQERDRREMARIALIDDDTICHFIFKQLMTLLKPGCPTECFTDPLKALKKINDGALHRSVILLDINMPVLSGLDLLMAIREKHDSTPVYILSSSDNLADKRRALAFENVMDYFIKPLTQAHVMAIWKTHFEILPR